MQVWMIYIDEYEHILEHKEEWIEWKNLQELK